MRTRIDETQVDALRQHWQRHHFVRLRDFLDAGALAFVHAQIAGGEFHEQVHPVSGREAVLAEGAAQRLLDLLVNDRRVLAMVERITGCPPIGGCLNGRIYRLLPASNEAHDWHDDNVRQRLLGLSINLTERAFEGGELQLREARTKAPVGAVRNTGPGDCVVFELGPRIEHRVTPVTGDTPRVAYAGWFEAGPSLKAHLERGPQRPATL